MGSAENPEWLSLRNALRHNADLFRGWRATSWPPALGFRPLTHRSLCQNRQRSPGYPPNPKQASVNPTEAPSRPAKKGPRTRAAKQRELTSCTREKWNQQSELNLTMALQIGRRLGPRRRKARTTVRGQGLAGARLEAVKNGRGGRFNNSGSALGLLRWSFDFYKLTIQAGGERENSSAGKPCHNPAGDSAIFPSGASSWRSRA